MSTATLSPPRNPRYPRPVSWSDRLQSIAPGMLLDALALLAFTSLAFVTLGYHPYAEDGGIYAAAVAARADTSLFPHDHAWVDAHTRYGQFVRMAGLLVNLTGTSAETVLFGLQCLGLLLLLAAALHLARTCYGNRSCAWWGIAALAVLAGLPVAGTSLYGCDPYCSARTLCTPLLLLAWSLQLRRQFHWLVPLLLIAACMHPLMAAWGCLPLLFTWALQRAQPLRTGVLVAFVAIAVFAILYWNSLPDAPVVQRLSHSRAYWYISQWHWYEWFGAAAPALLLLGIARGTPGQKTPAMVANIATCTTALCVLLALLFCRFGQNVSTLARLQPLRALHLVFLAFLPVAAGHCAHYLQTRVRRLAGISALAIACLCLCMMQRSLYPATRHLEWPGLASGNDWEEAFRWARAHTDRDALFALDADYITAHGNDAHGFRAVSHRSALPDRAKDGGVAAVLPELAPSWAKSVAATTDLPRTVDEQNFSQLQQLGVTWMVLERRAANRLPCAFQNTDVAVCALPELHSK